MTTTNLFDLSLTAEQLKAGVSGIDVADLNKDIADRVSFVQGTVAELLNGLAVPVDMVSKMIDVSGAPDPMKKVGEKGRNTTQADRQVVELTFPLYKWDRATGWDEDFGRMASVEDFRKTVFDAEYAYRQSLYNEIQVAIFKSKYREHEDKFDTNRGAAANGAPLKAYGFWNGATDGMSIPAAPNGSAFTATSHMHYNGTSGSSLSIYDVDTLLINNVREHGSMNGLALFVAPGGDSALSALSTANVPFQPTQYMNTLARTDQNRSVFVDNPNDDPDNKLLGTWRGIPVHSRSWVPTNYIACLALGAREKALGYRTHRRWFGMAPLPLVSDALFTAQTFRAYFGLAANNRSAGAVLDTANQTNYTDPSGLVFA